MKGNNTLTLNQAEMVRTIEYYLNNVQFKEPVLVAAVKEKPGDHVFHVKLEETVDDPLDKPPAS